MGDPQGERRKPLERDFKRLGTLIWHPCQIKASVFALCANTTTPPLAECLGNSGIHAAALCGATTRRKVFKMKGTLVFVFGVLLVFGMVFAACKTGNETGGGFVSQTRTVTNDTATLGLVGTTAKSNNSAVATVQIKSGAIEITSKAEGSATITVSASSSVAGIGISVSNTGSISVGTISKYNGAGSGTGNNYNLLFGSFWNISDAEIQSGIASIGLAGSLITASDGAYFKGSPANQGRTAFLNHPDFHLDGTVNGDWDYLMNEFKHKGIGMPDGDLKSKMNADKANCPMAGMFRHQNDLIVFYVSKNND
jgi:hypothetical protein